MQLGDESEHVNVVVSTVAEAEHLVPFLSDCKDHGRSVNVCFVE